MNDMTPPSKEDARQGAEQDAEQDGAPAARRRRWPLFALMCGLAVIAGLGLNHLTSKLLAPAPRQAQQSQAQLAIGGPFSLTDHTGRRVTDQDFRGRHMLVFFGYTHCPDICPVVLNEVSAALDQLGAEKDRVAPLFITVDPERDTVADLKEYMSNFPGATGLTGTVDEIKQVAAAYRTFYRKIPVEEGAEAGDYLVDHSALLFLMDGEGRYRTHFRHDATADDLAQGLAAALKEAS